MAYNQVKMTFGNIKAVRFADKWPNGRPFKHGAMEVQFGFQPASFASAVDEIEAYMTERGYVQGKDYHVPAWNTYGYGSTIGNRHVKSPFYITFNDDETFVMAKMGWGADDEAAS
jgi:hypothetical protein